MGKKGEANEQVELEEAERARDEALEKVNALKAELVQAKELLLGA